MSRRCRTDEPDTQADDGELKESDHDDHREQIPQGASQVQQQGHDRFHRLTTPGGRRCSDPAAGCAVGQANGATVVACQPSGLSFSATSSRTS